MDHTPLNEAERSHIDAILSHGFDPSDFLIENQLAARSKEFPQLSFSLQDTSWRELQDWTPSRYELVSFLPEYYTAYRLIRTASKAVCSKNDLPEFDFRIASDPNGNVNAYVVNIGYPSSSILINGNSYPLVWCNVGLMNHIVAVVRCLLRALMTEKETLEASIDRLAFGDSLEKSYDSLTMASPTAFFIIRLREEWDSGTQRFLMNAFPPLSQNEMESPYGQGVTKIYRSIVTFVTAHECGHLCLGHTGLFPLRSLSQDLRRLHGESLGREIEADTIALLLLWETRLVDFAWFGPAILYFTLASAQELMNAPSLASWQTRCGYFIKFIARAARQGGLDEREIMRVGEGIARTGVLINQWLHYEWARATGLSHQASFELYGDIKLVFESALSSSS